MIKEFKDFILKGNLLMTAVAFIMGASFGKVTESFTGLVTAIIGKLFALARGAPQTSDGKLPEFGKLLIGGVDIAPFLNGLINLVIVGFVLFLVVKAYNRATAPKVLADPTPPPTPADIALLTEIRDLLKR